MKTLLVIFIEVEAAAVDEGDQGKLSLQEATRQPWTEAYNAENPIFLEGDCEPRRRGGEINE